jgi:hypothetical protein
MITITETKFETSDFYNNHHIIWTFLLSWEVILLIFATFILVVIPIILVILHIKSSTRDGGTVYKVKRKEDITSEAILYVVTYVIPFLTEEPLKTANIVTLSILMITLAIVYTRANLFYVNPILSLLGYRIYKLIVYEDREKLVGENSLIFISKKPSILKDQEIEMNEYSGSIYIEH